MRSSISNTFFLRSYFCCDVHTFAAVLGIHVSSRTGTLKKTIGAAPILWVAFTALVHTTCSRLCSRLEPHPFFGWPLQLSFTPGTPRLLVLDARVLLTAHLGSRLNRRRSSFSCWTAGSSDLCVFALTPLFAWGGGSAFEYEQTARQGHTTLV